MPVICMGFKTNVIANTAADMNMLQIIKFYFTNIGIDLEIRKKDPEEWIAFVEKEHKHDQLIYRPYGPFWSLL